MGGSTEFNNFFNTTRQAVGVQFRPSSTKNIKSAAREVIRDIIVHKSHKNATFGIDGGSLWYKFIALDVDAQLLLGKALVSLTAHAFDGYLTQIAVRLERYFNSNFEPYVM
jgi:hypothetical protein